MLYHYPSSRNLAYYSLSLSLRIAHFFACPHYHAQCTFYPPIEANHMGIKLVLWWIYFIGGIDKMGTHVMAKYSTQSAALIVLPFVTYTPAISSGV
jgi:hypothetical protein